MIITAEHLEQLPNHPKVEEMIRLHYPHLYSEYKLRQLKNAHRPENKKVYDKPHDTGEYGTRRRSRPWDNCWFSNKPHIISLTIEEAISKYPDYMKWCYKNLSIKWSVHTVRLFEQMIIKIN
jgi:hypothetical protein